MSVSIVSIDHISVILGQMNVSFVSFQESGDDEYHGEHSDTEDEVDSDFDIDEGDEPDSDQEEDAPRRKSRVVTKAYKVVKVILQLSDSAGLSIKK